MELCIKGELFLNTLVCVRLNLIPSFFFNPPYEERSSQTSSNYGIFSEILGRFKKLFQTSDNQKSLKNVSLSKFIRSFKEFLRDCLIDQNKTKTKQSKFEFILLL